MAAGGSEGPRLMISKSSGNLPQTGVEMKNIESTTQIYLVAFLHYY